VQWKEPGLFNYISALDGQIKDLKKHELKLNKRLTSLAPTNSAHLRNNDCSLTIKQVQKQKQL
ncbi:hypothetical protein LINGRAHAP2_LOCUS2855, partial [Linum grandiflorum]